MVTFFWCKQTISKLTAQCNEKAFELEVILNFH
jgi:hypothetical protein